MMASAQVVETSVNTNNSPSQDYTTNKDDHSNHNNNICHTSLMLAKYDTSFFFLFTKNQNVHSVLLSSVHLRSGSLKLSHWEKDWSLVPYSVKV